MKEQDYYVLKLMYDQSEAEISRLLKENQYLQSQLSHSAERTKYWKDKYRELVKSLQFAY
jgi:hypothetical protein